MGVLTIVNPDFARLICGAAGILVADHHVTAIQLRQKLAAVLHYKDTKLTLLFNHKDHQLTSLFNHKDHQNVPVAVALLQLLKSLATAKNFTDEVENCPLVLLGTFAGYLVDPFITPTL